MYVMQVAGTSVRHAPSPSGSLFWLAFTAALPLDSSSLVHMYSDVNVSRSDCSTTHGIQLFRLAGPDGKGGMQQGRATRVACDRARRTITRVAGPKDKGGRTEGQGQGLRACEMMAARFTNSAGIAYLRDIRATGAAKGTAGGIRPKEHPPSRNMIGSQKHPSGAREWSIKSPYMVNQNPYMVDQNPCVPRETPQLRNNTITPCRNNTMPQ